MIKKKIFKSIILTSMIVFVASFALIMGTLYEHFSDVLQYQLKNQTILAAHSLENEGEKYFENLKDADVRFTWIGTDGTVLYDSNTDSSKLENHMQREEVKEALAEGYGESRRMSNTVMHRSFYCATRMDDGTVLRLSMNQSTVIPLLLGLLTPILWIMIIAVVISIILANRFYKKIIAPLNDLDLDHPIENEGYDELAPLLSRIDSQQTELREQQAVLDRTEQIRREFTANVSHELKTPIQSISGYSELLAGGMVNEEDRQKFAGKIYSESIRMNKLVEDIIELTHLDEGGGDMKHETVDLDALAKKVAENMQSFATKARVSLDYSGESVKINGIPSLLESLVSNLCDNAIKYNQAGGSVHVSLRSSEKGAVLTVADTGIGISEQNRARVFERFYRVDKSRSNAAQGTGLGLSIVKHVAQIHDAAIHLESEEGKGTTITVEFKN